MDENLTYELHIDNLVSRCTGTLLALSHERHSLPAETLPIIVHALVMSFIRYCISVYGTHSATQLRRIQKLINFCARVLSGRHKLDHISDVVS